MTHRGPDEKGTFYENGVSLGIRRLRIIDLETGTQPIFNEDRSKVIVFNGEIYNFLELRDELVDLGHIFKSVSDTEVVLHAYEEWGVKCLNRFNGMFGIAIYDREKKKAFLARDRLGIKPLFYSFFNGVFRFSSELRAFTSDTSFSKEIDPLALDCYLSFGYVVSPRTIYKHAMRLSAGHYLEFDRSEELRINKYWDVPVEIDVNWTEQEALEEFKTKFRKAVRLRLISDVPLGAFLSGGIDSSAVVGQMATLESAPIQTFSIGFETRGYDELGYAKAVANQHHTQHREFILSPDLSEIGEEVLNSLDEPLADSSIIPTFLISKMSRKYVTVALSGDGGDELFGGYDQYMADRIVSPFKGLPMPFFKFIQMATNRIHFSNQKKGLVNKIKRLSVGLTEDPSLRHLRWMLYMPHKLKQKLYTPEMKKVLREIDSPYAHIQQYFERYPQNSDWELLTGVDLKMWISDDILSKVDRMSMLNSLEVRVPFLDHEVVEFVTQLPPRIRFQNGTQKGFCKTALKDLLSSEVLSRKEKQGFSFPLRIWAQDSLCEKLELSEFFDKSFGGRFETKGMETILDNRQTGSNGVHLRWLLLILFKWHANFTVC